MTTLDVSLFDVEDVATMPKVRDMTVVHLDGHGVDAQRAASMGWTRHSGGVKHRYLYVLGSKTERRQRMAQLRLPVLPYPKAKPH